MVAATWLDTDDEPALVPQVDELHDNLVPRIRIYDAAGDGSYWFRRIGFNRSLLDED